MKSPGKSRWRWAALGLVLALALALWAYRQWQGPVVPVAVVEVTTLEQWVVAAGRVAAPSRVRIGSELTGVVAERFVRDGDAVQAGQVLVQLVDDEWQARVQEATAALRQLTLAQRPQAQAALAEAESRLAQAQREVTRRRALLDRRAVSREDVEQVEHARVQAATALEQARLRLAALQQGGADTLLLQARLAVAQAGLARTQVRSTVAGLVVTHDVEPGDLVSAGRVLFEVAAAGPAEVKVLVDERYLSVLAVGQPAQVRADAWPQRPFTATLTRLATAVDAARGAIELTLRVDAPVPEFLRNDMTVSVSILTAALTDALVIPRDAVARQGGSLQAGSGDTGEVRVMQDGRVASRTVVLGVSGDAGVAVVSGLQSGEQVLLDPAWPVGDRVRSQVQAPANASVAERGEVPVRF